MPSRKQTEISFKSSFQNKVIMCAMTLTDEVKDHVLAGYHQDRKKVFMQSCLIFLPDFIIGPGNWNWPKPQ